MLHAILLAASLMADAPAPADVTETVRLTFVAAGDVERLLHGSQPPSPRAEQGGLIAPNIHAWSMDTRHNALTFTGSREGIDVVKSIIRLLDVPARGISVAVRFVPLPGGADPAGPAAKPVDEKEVAALEKQPAVQAWTMPSTNNLPIRFLWPASKEDQVLSITPRINGDGSVTLIIGPATRPTSQSDIAGSDKVTKLEDLKPVPSSNPGLVTNPGSGYSVRRVSSGQATAIAFPHRGYVMWIRPTLLPDDPAPGAAK
jgi:hypothetical protein